MSRLPIISGMGAIKAFSSEAIKRLPNFKKKKPSRFAGGWEMDDKEAEELKKELKDAWKKWEL
jgi:predicted CopG family antitoxin